MKSKNITAIILSRRNINEADRILSVFSFEEGRCEILAKGSRKLKSKMAGHIEPFTLGKYYLIEGKSFDILAGAETINLHSAITNEISLYKDASYICELIRLVLPEGEEEKIIFNLTKKIFKILPTLKPEKAELAKRFFEFTLLSEIGYKPNLDYCKKCNNKILESLKYFGNFEGVTCSNCEESGNVISLNTLKLLRLFQVNEIDKILKIKVSKDNLNELKSVIYSYICDIIPRPPKSEGF